MMHKAVLEALPQPTLTPTVAVWPILYEDDEEGDLGESNPHVISDEIIHVGLCAHLADRPELQAFSNMNLYYQRPGEPVSPTPYVSPDNMVVQPFQLLPADTSSYSIGTDGPAPRLTVEILSERSAQQRDLGDKAVLYALLKVAEYILVDVTGRFLPQRLLLRRLQADGTFRDVQDADAGVTSALGFRLMFDADGMLRLISASTGERYARPMEAQGEARARRQAEADAANEARARQEAEAAVRRLNDEIERLRQMLPQPPETPPS